MCKQIKNSPLKKIITPAILVVTLAASYYFISFLPSHKLAQAEHERLAFIFDKQTECKNICESLYLDDKDSLSDYSVLTPEYGYNEERNACFYSGGWLSISPLASTKRIVNCQTNAEVLTKFTQVSATHAPIVEKSMKRERKSL